MVPSVGSIEVLKKFVPGSVFGKICLQYLLDELVRLSLVLVSSAQPPATKGHYLVRWQVRGDEGKSLLSFPHSTVTLVSLCTDTRRHTQTGDYGTELAAGTATG